MRLKQALERSNGCLTQIDRVLRAGGFEARLVGGAVRDLLIAQQPKDFDIATTADPEMVAALFQTEGHTVVPTGLQHGTVTVVCNGEPYEITTLRKDVECDGRHAVVQFTEDWEEDARRRDFTFNAMSIDLQSGELFDYFGGEEDLLNGKVKFVGSAMRRITEDSLRILRYFRFLGRFEHCRELDTEAIDAINVLAPWLKGISGERIWMEMSRILTSNRMAMLSILMSQTGVLDAIGLNVPGTEHMSFGHDPDGTEVAKVRNLTRDPVTVLAGLILNRKMCGVPKEAIEHMRNTVVEGWKISSVERDLLDFLLKHFHRHQREFDFYLDLAVEDGHKYRASELCALTGAENVRDYLAAKTLPVFPVRGQDLLDAGMQPGPEVGQALADMKKVWKQTRYVLNRDELMEDIKP